MSPTPTSRTAQEDELSQLRARVASLEAEMSRRKAGSTAGERTSSSGATTRTRHVTVERSRRSSNVADDDDTTVTPGGTVNRAADAMGRKVEEGSRVLRALVLASLEPVRITADATVGFIDELAQRNQTDQDITVSDLVTSLPGDLYAGFARALDRAVDIVPDTVDTFQEQYRTARPIRVGWSRASTQRTARSGATPRVVATTPASGTSAPAPDGVSATFNTEVQPSSREFGSSLVVRKDSVVVPGTESQTSPTTLTWKPAVPLTPGAYTVGVFNVESADGTELPDPFYFSFTVSAAS